MVLFKIKYLGEIVSTQVRPTEISVYRNQLAEEFDDRSIMVILKIRLKFPTFNIQRSTRAFEFNLSAFNIGSNHARILHSQVFYVVLTTSYIARSYSTRCFGYCSVTPVHVAASQYVCQQRIRVAQWTSKIRILVFIISYSPSAL